MLERDFEIRNPFLFYPTGYITTLFNYLSNFHCRNQFLSTFAFNQMVKL